MGGCLNIVKTTLKQEIIGRGSDAIGPGGTLSIEFSNLEKLVGLVRLSQLKRLEVFGVKETELDCVEETVARILKEKETVDSVTLFCGVG